MKHEVQLTPKMHLAIGDLQNKDHIGFITSDKTKWQIVYIYDGFHAIQDSNGRNQNCTWIYNYGSKTVQELLSVTDMKELYKFDTRKELYQWLSED